MKLVLSGVHKHFKSRQTTKQVLRGVDLALVPGEIVAVVGSNASGKTTLVGLLARLIAPSSGTVEHIDDETDNDREGLAVLWQNYRESNFPWLNVLDNVALSGVFARRKRDDARARAASVLADLLPEVDPSSRVYRLSGGQQQIVSLARALASEPRAVLADEALGAIDQARNWLLVSRFEQWWLARRTPVLWVSHNLDEAMLIADRIVLLSVSTGKIEETIRVGADRPRTVSSLSGREATEIRRRLVDFLKGEEEWRLRTREVQRVQ